jgi:hypothetical protein
MKDETRKQRKQKKRIPTQNMNGFQEKEELKQKQKQNEPPCGITKKDKGCHSHGTVSVDNVVRRLGSSDTPVIPTSRVSLIV